MDVQEDCDISDYEESMEDESQVFDHNKNLAFKADYKVLAPGDVIEEMDASIKEVNAVIQLPATTTRILLNHFDWNQEKLLERYYDAPDKLFKEAGVIPPKGLSYQRSVNSVTDTTDDSEDTIVTASQTCLICFDEFETGDMTDLGCGHSFCNSCWTHFLTIKVKDDGEGSSITCMEPKCTVTVDDKTVMSLIQEPETKKRYQQLICSSFVQCNRNFQFCPNKTGCDFVIKADEKVCQKIICKCGHTFCFKCIEDWHEPVSCDFLKLWNKKSSDDSETVHWITAHTKLCPKCEATIEKNGGCNHMVCQRCKTEFCWSCMTAWASHQHSMGCTSYREENDPSRVTNVKKAEQSLKRYLFYFDRFHNHKQSLGFEKELRASVAEKIDLLQVSSTMTWTDVQFLKEAVDVLNQCRQTLMHTYIFAYFLKEDNNAQIFLENQRNLQESVEKLSAFLERDLVDVTTESMVSIKQNVIDMYVFCGQRRQVLIEHILQGCDHNEWKFIDMTLSQ